MAVFQIGRLFSDYDVDITATSWAGSRWSVAGDVVLSSANRADEGVAIREQIIGMNGNPDEPFVAVQWSEEPTVNGFYRLLGINCQAGQMHLVDGLLSWSAELERVTGSQFAPLETHGAWKLLTNSRSVTYPASFTLKSVTQFAVPGAAIDLTPVSGTVSGSTSVISSPTNLATGFGSIITSSAATLPASGIWSWSVDPVDYYDGNCVFTTDFGAATDEKVFGRRADNTTDWMVSNGMVRFSLEPTNKYLRVEHWDSGAGAWVRANSTDYRFKVGGNIPTYYVATILRNAPECVTVRVSYNAENASHPMARLDVDLSVIRGSSAVYGYMSSSLLGNPLGSLEIETNPAVAATALTGGFRATSSDANGNQFVLATGSPACTDTLASGETATTASAASLTFGISSTAWVTSDLAALEFFARRAEVTRVVAR